MPPTLRALLAARLDQLDAPERRVLERGAVEGEIFHRGAVQALAPEEPEVLPRLAALVRRELIRPDRPSSPARTAFRFCHLLIRDAAYDALPKAVARRPAPPLRRLARGARRRTRRAGRARRLPPRAGRALSDRARPAGSGRRARRGRPSGGRGRRAFWRGDWRAAIGLLERALSLTRPYRFELRVELELADALYLTDVARAVLVADAAAERAAAAENEADEALARAAAAQARLLAGQCSADELERRAREALPLLEAAGDDDGLAHVWYAFAWVANMRQRYEDWAQAAETASGTPGSPATRFLAGSR